MLKIPRCDFISIVNMHTYTHTFIENFDAPFLPEHLLGGVKLDLEDVCVVVLCS